MNYGLLSNIIENRFYLCKYFILCFTVHHSLYIALVPRQTRNQDFDLKQKLQLFCLKNASARWRFEQTEALKHITERGPGIEPLAAAQFQRHLDHI